MKFRGGTGMKFREGMRMKFREGARRLKREVPALFLALKNRDTPLLAKLFAGITVAYALSPIDLIPDFIPVLGYLDDLILLPCLVAITLRLIPGEIMQECREQAEGLWEDKKPKKWYFALPILLLWAVLGLLAVKWAGFL